MNLISLTLRKSPALQRLMLLALLPGLALFPVPLKANPSGQQVIAGNVNFQGLGTSSLDINNLSQAAIINWQSFSIQSGEVTRINQGANAVTLNRVISGNPTAIYGALQAAQGSVMVINPNGIVVHNGGTIDVAGMLTMSTLDITNEDLLDRGSNRFKGSGTAGIKNYGAITSDSGDVVMLGNFLQNAGSVTANRGVVAFGAGGDMIVEQTVYGSTISVLAGGSGGIENSGVISGAAAELKATGNVYSLAVQNSGLIRANGYDFRGGRLTLSGGSTGSVINTGQLAAQNSDGSGGQVSISGRNLNIGGDINVSGAEVGDAGGAVDISGVNVALSETASVFASGAIGGSVSISGTETNVIGGQIDASSHRGAGGTIDATGASLTIGSTARLDVSGVSKGGTIRAGGGFQGKGIEIVNATTTTVEEGSLMLADGSDGDGGNIIVWADGDTFYGGEISAQATGITGDGGFVEVSGKNKLSFRGTVSTLSATGANGTLLLDPTDVVIGDVADDGITISDDDLVTALGSNHVVIHTSSTGGAPGDITVRTGSDALDGYASVNTLSFFAHGDIVINDNIQNNGDSVSVGGGIIMFAGWDGTGLGGFGFDPETPGGFLADTAADPAVTSAAILNGDYGVWGQNSGSIVINGSGANEVGVGSAYGETALFGHQLTVNGGAGNDGRYGQVGFHNATLNPTGNILLYAKDDIVISAIGTTNSGNAQNDAHVIVGHGGSDRDNANVVRTGDGDLSGDIMVISEGGGLYMRGGNDRSFSQVGHGGYDLVGGKDGNITVIASIIDMRGQFLPGGGADSSAYTGATIGHGGGNSDGGGKGFSGDIYVKSGSDIYGDSGFAVTNGNAAVYWQIGHGGYRSGAIAHNQLEATARQTTGANLASDLQISYTLEGHNGAIYVEAGGNINVLAGSRSNSTSMIGHGGRESHGSHRLDMLSAASPLTSGLKDGITVIAGGDIIFDRKDHPTVVRGSSDNPVQIGLGGLRAGGRFSGDIDIQAGGDFEMHGGHSNSFAQVGHGGFADGGDWNSDGLDFPDHNNNQGHATLSGDISVVAGGDVSMYSGGLDGSSNAYSQIGHGGLYRVADGLKADGSIVDAADAGHHGDILVDSGGNLIISSKPREDGSVGTDISGSSNYAMIGHGGYRANGDHYGRIDVDAEGDILLQAGYGGWEEYQNDDDRYDLSQTGDSNFAMIGHGGFASTLYRDLFMTTLSDGRKRWTGGYQFNGNTQGKGIGSFGDATTSAIDINAGGDFDILASSELSGFADFHLDPLTGLPQSRLDLNTFLVSGDVTNVVDNAGVLTITAVGHGLVDGDQVAFTNLQADFTFKLATVTFIDDDTFTVDATEIPGVAVTDVAGNWGVPYLERSIIERALRGFAQVGHGGYGDSDGNRRMTFDSVTTGNIDINIGGSLSLLGGGIEQKDDTVTGLSVGDWNRVEYNNAMIGHGGQFFRSSYDGAITINSGGDIDVQAGKGFREFSRIGHGGYESGITPNDIGSTTVVGDISVIAAGSISLTGGGSINPLARSGDSEFNYTQIGHGANNMGLTVTGQNITVTAGNDLSLSGGVGLRDAYAHIGHGALNNGDGDFSGAINVSAGGDLTLTKTTGRVFSQDDAGNDILSVRAYVKIGHGDSDSGGRTKSLGQWDGDISVKVGDDLVSVGGVIGHTDPTNGDGTLRSRDGNTYLAVGRNAPNTDGGGRLITDAETVFTSSQLGVGSELRLYLPSAGGVDNFIGEGANLNGAAYTRTPFPDGTRADESLSTDFTFDYVEGVPSGDFILDGDYPGNLFGSYQIYYADLVSLLPKSASGGGATSPLPGFDFMSYIAFDLFDVIAIYDGFDVLDVAESFSDDAMGSFGAILPEEGAADESPVRMGEVFFDEDLDGAFGVGNAFQSGGPADPEEDGDEDGDEGGARDERGPRLISAGGQLRGGANAVYVYDPSTGSYSSLRIFGAPRPDRR